MTNEDRRSILATVKAQQEAGERFCCPRCGQDTMKRPAHTNALSRHADVYVCDACGTQEAMLDWMNNPLPLSGWAIFLPKPPAGDFRASGVKEVWDILNKEQIGLLMELFRAHYEGTMGSAAVREEAISRCKGLTQIWAEPFVAQYEAADGTLVVQIRKVDGKTQVTGSILPK